MNDGDCGYFVLGVATIIITVVGLWSGFAQELSTFPQTIIFGDLFVTFCWFLCDGIP